MSYKKIIGIVFLPLWVWGCAYTPVPFEGKHKKGPGLLTGQTGHFRVIGPKEEDQAESLKKPSDSLETQEKAQEMKEISSS